MKISELLRVVLNLLNKQPKNARYKTPEGNVVSVKDLKDSLTRLLGWLYKDLTADSIERVVHCRDCVHYKRYRSRKNIKSAPFYACKLDRKKRMPDFYCKDGLSK